ncbi:hypothetical protein J6590_013724 [Homalodisca vitripennis]|nr:hypothetical protein J6590_013724 [Homalodisca vitripennis]
MYRDDKHSVFISVTNINDNTPLSEEPVYYPHVPENSPANTPVLQITATRPHLQDHWFYLTARCSFTLVFISVTNINDNTPLSEEPVYYPHVPENSPANTPVLQITATRPHLQDHWFYLTARCSFTLVFISVTNINDNTPLSEEPVYYPHVPENSPANTPVLQITATDGDLDPSLVLTYRITGGNPESFFSMDSSTG